MKRVLVTGGGGYIGSRVVKTLYEKGYQVHILTRPNNNDFSLCPITSFCHIHRIDIFDVASIDQLMSRIRPTHLLHLAWYTEHGKFWESSFNRDWVLCSLQLLFAFERFGGERAVFAGSCAEYDWSYGYCVEDLTPCHPASFYGQCKHILNQVISSTIKNSKLSFAWGRVFFVYGDDEPKNKLFPSILLRILRGESATCLNGNIIRDYMHVRDVAGAFAELLDSKVVGNVNISSGQPRTIRSLCESLEKMIKVDGKVEFEMSGNNEKFPIVLGATDKLYDEIGFRPQYDGLSGIEATVEYWKKIIN